MMLGSHGRFLARVSRWPCFASTESNLTLSRLVYQSLEGMVSAKPSVRIFCPSKILWMTQTSWTRNPVLMGKTTSCSSVSPYKEKRRFSLRQRVSLSRESSSWSNRCRKWNQLPTTCTTRTDGWLSKFPDLAHIDTEIIIVVKDVDHALIV